MWLASYATAWNPSAVLDAVGDKPDRAVLERLRELAERDEHAQWERELLLALGERDDRLRAARVNEQLTELDYRIGRWQSVPRLCARITTSFAFLLAALVLRNGLADTTDFSEPTIRALVGDGLTVVFMGFVGTGFCIAANREAREVARARVTAIDMLVERLEGAA